MIRRFRIWLASRRLEKLIRARKDSFEVRDFERRRNAALKGKGRKPRVTVLGAC